MIELIGPHRPDQTDVIDDRSEMRQHLRNLYAALAMTRKPKLRPHDRGVGTNEGVPLTTNHRRREGLSLQLGQLRLVVEEVELTGSARHEEVNDPLGTRREVRRATGGV